MQSFTEKNDTIVGYSQMQRSEVNVRKGGFDLSVGFDDSISQLAMQVSSGSLSRYLGKIDITYMAPRQNQLVFVHKNRLDHSKLVGITSANGLDLTKPDNKTSATFEENYYLVGINSLDVKLNNEGKAISSSMKVYSGGLDNVRVSESVMDGDYLYWEMPLWSTTESTDQKLGRDLVIPKVKPFRSDANLTLLMSNLKPIDGNYSKEQIIQLYHDMHRIERKIFGQALERRSKGDMCQFRWINSK
jgi:hypothetical protein